MGGSTITNALLNNGLSNWFLNGFQKFGFSPAEAKNASLIVSIIVIITMVTGIVLAIVSAVAWLMLRHNPDDRVARKIAHYKWMIVVGLIASFGSTIIISMVLGIAGAIYTSSV